MRPPWPTFGDCQKAWAILPPHQRLEWFHALPEDEQDRAWEYLRHQVDGHRRLENAEFGELDLGPREDSDRSTHRSPARGSRGTAYRTTSDDVLDQIPPPIYMEALAEVPVPVGGGSICCPLPDHDDAHPSCRVYGDPGRGWYCFACNRGGSAIDLASHLTGIQPKGDGYRELRTWIAERVLGVSR